VRRLPYGLRSVLVTIGLTVAVGTALAPPAAAHSTLLFASPAVDGSVPDSPAELSLTFDSPVSLPGAAITVTGPAGRSVTLGGLRVRGTTVTASVPVVLPPGTHTVRWQVTADDGDAIQGVYRFAVGPVASGSSLLAGGYASPPAAPGQWPTAVLRWLLFGSLAVAAGGLAAARMAGRLAVSLAVSPMASVPRRAPSPWIRPAALAGAVAAAGLALLVAGNGSLLAGVSHPGGALDSRPGVVALAQLVGFGVAYVSVRRHPGGITRVGLAGLGVVFVAEAVRGHPQAAAPGWGAPVIAVHLVAVSLWGGALLYVVRTAWVWRERPAAVRRLVGGYARLAAWLFGAVVATGAIAGLAIIPLPAMPSTTYGRTLLIKLAFVAAVAALALTARLRLRQATSPGKSAATAGTADTAQPHVTPRPLIGGSIGRVIGLARAEAAALTLVLAVTALLVTLPPPQDAARALPFAPAPSGPVVPLGALAGQISVSALASNGQLVIRLFVPGSDPQPPPPNDDARATIVSAPPPAPRYELSAALADPGGTTTHLRMRRCGTGCFVAPARWASGTSHLTLRTSATGWGGGAVAFPVTWPPRPDPAALRRAVDAMARTPRFTLYERTTSDTRRGPGNVRQVKLSGKRFLASQPYRANAPIVIGDGEGAVTVAIPAERIQARLTLDRRGRIATEVLTAPRYLITRIFTYPDHER
jgi:copper transport protein